MLYFSLIFDLQLNTILKNLKYKPTNVFLTLQQSPLLWMCECGLQLWGRRCVGVDLGLRTEGN